jgi:hypothetical protein
MWNEWKILVHVHVYEDPNISFQRRLSVVIVWQEYSNCTRLVKYLALPVVVEKGQNWQFCIKLIRCLYRIILMAKIVPILTDHETSRIQFITML